MKILLSTITVYEFYTQLALLYLKATLLNDEYLKNKVKVEIKEFTFADTDDFILWQIKKFSPQVIGFSCYVWNIQRILTLASKIKKLDRNIRIILGGPQVCPIAKIVLGANSQIDVIVRGEGEFTFLELSKAFLNAHHDINKISGITYRHNGKIISNPDREIISDLDSIPSAYLHNLIPLENREVCLETQRGCIFGCHFCYYYKGFEKVRFFSMERVKKELFFLLKQKIKSIYLMDPVFNLDMKRAKEICKFIIENNKNSIPFHTEIRAELINEELAALFSRANFKCLEVGLQSTGDEVLSLVNRKLNVKKFVDGINLLKKYSLNTEVHLILGLPGDTAYSFEKSLEFALNLETKWLPVYRLQVLPGTEIWRRAQDLGITYEDKPPYYFLQSKSLPFDDVINIQEIIGNLDLFRNRETIKFLCKETKIKLLDMIKLWVDWLDDEKFLLNYQDKKVLKNKFREFIKYVCEKNNIEFNFYSALLQKELTPSRSK